MLKFTKWLLCNYSSQTETVGWIFLFSHKWTFNCENASHLQLNDTPPPTGHAQDYISLDAWALACQVFTPWLRPLVSSGVFGTSAMTNIMRLQSLLARKKSLRLVPAVEWSVSLQKMKGATTAVAQSFTRGRRVSWQGCRWYWRKVS